MRSIGLGIVALAVGAGGALHFSSQFWLAQQMSHWTAERQLDLRNLGTRIRTYARLRDGVLPISLQELVDAGIMAPEEISFLNMGMCIERRLRPIPTLGAPGKLILVYETYEHRLPDYGNSLFLDGTACTMGDDIEETLAEDNALRRANGLPELPP